jgi:hypothetical protein
MMNSTDPPATLAATAIKWAKLGFKLANLFAITVVGLCLVWIVGVFILAWWLKGFHFAIGLDWDFFGILLRFYVVTCGWGLALGALVGSVFYFIRRLVRRSERSI